VRTTASVRQEREVVNTHPPQRGGIFVEAAVKGAAPQRGAIFVGANVSMMQPIDAHVPVIGFNKYSTPLGCGSPNATLLQKCHPAGVERMNFFTPSSVVGISKRAMGAALVG